MRLTKFDPKLHTLESFADVFETFVSYAISVFRQMTLLLRCYRALLFLFLTIFISVISNASQMQIKVLYSQLWLVLHINQMWKYSSLERHDIKLKVSKCGATSFKWKFCPCDYIIYELFGCNMGQDWLMKPKISCRSRSHSNNPFKIINSSLKVTNTIKLGSEPS